MLAVNIACLRSIIHSMLAQCYVNIQVDHTERVMQTQIASLRRAMNRINSTQRNARSSPFPAVHKRYAISVMQATYQSDKFSLRPLAYSV